MPPIMCSLIITRQLWPQMIEDRGQMSDDRRQRAEDGGQKTEDRGQKIDYRGQMTDLKGIRLHILDCILMEWNLR